MKYNGRDSYLKDPGEPALRSCFACNSAHERLMAPSIDFLHYCLWCDRYWIHGRYLDSFETMEEMDDFMRERLPWTDKAKVEIVDPDVPAQDSADGEGAG